MRVAIRPHKAATRQRYTQPGPPQGDICRAPGELRNLCCAPGHARCQRPLCVPCLEAELRAMQRERAAQDGAAEAAGQTPSVGAPAGRAVRIAATKHSTAAEMSFEEIGRRMGISLSAAQQYCESGLRKLRARPYTMAKLAGIAEALRQERAKREAFAESMQGETTQEERYA
jgi:hypothetical protein